MGLYINQHKIIFSRKNLALLASVSGTSKSITIGDADLAIIESIALQRTNSPALSNNTENNIDELVSTIVRHPIIVNGFKSLNPDKIKHRIKQYKEVDVYLDNPVVNPPDIQAIPLYEIDSKSPHKDDISLDSLPKNLKLRLSTHLGVNITPEGFSTWSSKHNSFIQLSAWQVAIIIGFGDGADVQQLVHNKTKLGVAAHELEQTVIAAKNAGLLTSLKEKISNTEEVLTPFETETKTSIGLAKDWQNLPKTNKIPVYFVPHMENHFPLALGVLFSALINHKDGMLLERFQFIPVNFLEPNDLFNGPYRKFGPGVWLFSNYMWSIDVNMQISSAIKQHKAANFTIHGGPSTPDYQQACEDFLSEHKSVDIAVHGEGEVTITEIFECIVQTKEQSKSLKVEAEQQALSKVGGLTYRESLTGRFIRTGPRERMKLPDIVPSPYLSGLFDGYKGRVEAAIIETNRGCPYGCTFCDWGSATNQKIRKFDMQRVKDEITWIGKNKVRVMWIADANYGLYDRDIEISQFIVDTKKEFGYPQEIVVNYTKNSTWRLVEIIKIFTEGGIIGQGIISIQTTDEKTLEVINRKNIRTQRYDELAQAFTDLNLPLSTDLMIGLPGMTVESFQADLQRYMDMDVSVKAYPTQLLPNSPMAEPGYMKKYQIKADEHSFLTSTYSYTEKDLARMKAIYEVYVMADGYSLLRYVLRFMQWEHDVKSIDFISKLLDDCRELPNAYPLLTWATYFFNGDKSMPSGWTLFYQQLGQYIEHHYDISSTQQQALQTVLAVNLAAMPDDAVQYPITIDLKHDFHAYFHQAKQDVKPLASFGSGQMRFSDPNRLSIVDLNSAQYDSHQYFWELYSSVARAKSIAEFAA